MTGLEGTLNLKDNVAATITSSSGANTLSFVNGILNTGSVSSVLTGAFDPTSTDSISLGNGDSMEVKAGTLVQAVSVTSAATATILGQPRFASAISLTDSASVLQLGITTQLNQSVTGAGTLSLLDDVCLGSGVAMPSLVALNNKMLSLFGGTYSVGTTFSGGGNILFESGATLTEVWTIGSASENYSINGNGCILDLSSSGKIIFNGGNLYISDLHIRGLSDTNSLVGTGRIIFSGVTLELAGNFSRTDGSFTFRGEACKIITAGSTFDISGSGNEILVDGIILKFDQLDGSGSNPIAAVSGAAINFSNGGQIQSATGVASENLIIEASSYPFARNFFLTDTATIHVTNSNTANPKAVTISGGGHSINFPLSSGNYLVLDDNVQITFSNIVLRNYYPAAIAFGASSTITFGDGVVLEMGPDLTIGTTDPAWVFIGNATIDGKGASLNIDKVQGVSITGVKTLIIKNLHLNPSVVSGFAAVDDAAKIKLQDVVVSLKSAGLTYSQGHLDVSSFVKLTGNAGTSAASVKFKFTSKGNMTILADAELFVDNNVLLKLNVDPTNDTTLFDSKRHFSMAEIGSKLTLSGCSIETTNTGLALDKGTLKIIDLVNFTATSGSGAEFEIGSDLEVFLSPAANFKMNGPMIYQESIVYNYLKYGDLFSLKNNSFGFYLGYTAPVDAGNGWLEYIGRNLSSPDDTVQFYAQQDDTPSRWGSQGGTPGLYTGSKIGQPVKSGDSFRFERFYSASQPFQTNPNSRMPFFIYDQPSPTTSGANYKRANIGLNNSSYSYIMRIFKQGGNVGESISENDLIYLVGYKQPNPGTQFPNSAPASLDTKCILSTLNEDATVGGQYYQILSETGLKEVFPYESTGPITGFPSNIQNNSLFQVKGIVSGAYATAAPYTAYDDYVTNNVFYDIIGGHNGQGYTVAYAVQIYLPGAYLDQF